MAGTVTFFKKLPQKRNFFKSYNKMAQSGSGRAGCPCRYKSYLRDPIPIPRTTWGCGS